MKLSTLGKMSQKDHYNLEASLGNREFKTSLDTKKLPHKGK